MAFKVFEVDGIGAVTVYKRRGSRSLRLSVRHDGSIRVTIPTWTPYVAGVEFARARSSWVRRHAVSSVATELLSGQLIGKAHHLLLEPDNTLSKPVTRLQPQQATVRYPSRLSSSDSTVQKAARSVALRALRAQAERLLPGRLEQLAAKHGLTYGGVNIKTLKTRWGSCDQDKNIVLNLYLMLLPWHLIDYVLLHELMHTRVMQHGPRFWAALEELVPDVRSLRKEMRTYRPSF